MAPSPAAERTANPGPLPRLDLLVIPLLNREAVRGSPGRYHPRKFRELIRLSSLHRPRQR
jgi:hypothetical protein